MKASRLEGTQVSASLTHHILPNAGTMIGVCVTLVGLVKIVELQIGHSHVDEYAALDALLFMVSALTSYLSMRMSAESQHAVRLERIADLGFVVGLLVLVGITTLFAYETI